MRFLRRVVALVAVLVGLGLVAVGGAGLWADSQFDGGRVQATVILSGQHLLDVQYDVDERLTRTALWQSADRPLIGDTVLVEIAADRPGFARLTGDGRFGSFGLGLLVGGAVLVAGVPAIAGWRRRSRRVRDPLVAEEA